MTNNTTDARQTHDNDATMTRLCRDTLLRPHTVASIALQSGRTKRTVQRWVKQCGDIGLVKNNVPHFSDGEKAQILSHQQQKPAEETIEAELIEPGAIELHTSPANTAAPLVAFDLKPIQLATPTTANIAALQAQTAQLEQSAQQGANALSAYFAARMDVGLAQIAAEQDNLLKGIRANALNVGAQNLSSEGN